MIIQKGSIGNREYTANWKPREDTPYTFEYYKEDLDGEYVLDSTKTYNDGTTDTQITIPEKSYEGFTENTEHEGRKISGTITADGKLVLKRYYSRNSYKLTVVAGENISAVTATGEGHTGDRVQAIQAKDDTGADIANTYTAEYKYEQPVKITSTLKEITGYTVKFSKWETSDGNLVAEQTTKDAQITMPLGDITLTAKASKSVNSYGYTIEYYYDNVIDTLKTESGTAKYNQKISSITDMPEYSDKVITGYEIDTTKGDNGIVGLPLTITENASNNVVKVYYKATTYSIDYVLNNGSLANGDVNPSEYKITTETFTLKNPRKSRL